MAEFYFNHLKNFDRDRASSVASPRKKKRKHSDDDLNYDEDSTSVNIVDRVIDFSKYNLNSSLYALCRDWMNATSIANTNNRFQSSKQSRIADQNENNNNNKNDPNGNSNYFIRKLPGGLIIKQEEEEEEEEEDIGQEKNTKKCTFNLTEISDDGDQASLKKKHLEKWKNVRKEQITKNKLQNERYKESFNLLKSIYEAI